MATGYRTWDAEIKIIIMKKYSLTEKDASKTGKNQNTYLPPAEKKDFGNLPDVYYDDTEWSWHI